MNPECSASMAKFTGIAACVVLFRLGRSASVFCLLTEGYLCLNQISLSVKPGEALPFSTQQHQADIHDIGIGCAGPDQVSQAVKKGVGIVCIQMVQRVQPG